MTTSTSTAKDPKPTAERVEQLANRVLMGDIVLPEFQRPFVWKRGQILELLDSIVRNYPIGSMLVWESNQKLESKRSIADLEVAERSATYPVNYLLDGQQRLSTVCGVLHWKPGNPKSVWNVVYDLKAQEFFHIDHVDPLPIHQIPLRRLSDPSNYFKSLVPLDDEELSSRSEVLFNRFKDYQVPVVTLGDMTIKDVAPVFERINSTGTRLTIFDLMRAATWSPNFDLGKTVERLRAVIEPKKFGGLDDKTFLRAMGAAGGANFSAESIEGLRNLDAKKLGEVATATEEAAKRAADFLSTQVGVPRSEALPYANQFAVLCEVFRLVPHPDAGQLQEIVRWFWSSTLSGYFGGWNEGQMGADARALRAWATGKTTSIETTFLLPTSSLWKVKPFRSNSAVSKMLGLMLAHATPVDLLNGQKIDVDKSLTWSNDKEYHHFFPQNYLKTTKPAKGEPNLIANIILLTSKSNIEILDQAPSAYLGKIIEEQGHDVLVSRLAASLVPESALDAALKDDYEAFLAARSEYIHERALQLTSSTSSTTTVAPESVEDSDDDPTE